MGSRTEQLEFRSELKGDASIAGGSLAHCTSASVNCLSVDRSLSGFQCLAVANDAEALHL